MARMSQILWDWQHSVTDLKILCSQRKHRNGKNHLDVKFSFMRALVYSWSIQFYPTNPQNPEKPERFQLTLETSWHCQTSDWCILSPAQHLVRNKEKGRQTDLRAGKKKVFLWSRQPGRVWSAHHACPCIASSKENSSFPASGYTV